MKEKKIDPILVSILQRRFKSLTQEMGLTLLRTTRSPILNEAKDFVTGLYDAKGRTLEQSDNTLILVLALQPECEYIVDYYGEEIYPGDVILHNDVFTKGNQNADLSAFKPIFYEDGLVAWAACKAHVADIGGAEAGGYNPHAREIWQEALRITPIKVYEKGKFRKDVWDMIFANIRYNMVAEDTRAQIGSCVVGERGIKGLIDRYDLETFKSHVEYLFDSTEKMMRSEIRAIPDGVYTGESYVNYDGVTEGSRSKIKVTITVAGDEITFDYTGTDPQTPGFVNAPFSSSAAAVLLTFLMLVSPGMPNNYGMLRPIHINIPEGTFLNAKFPAATTFGNHLVDQNSEAIFKALSKALPQRVTAAWNRMFAGTLVGIDFRNGQPYVDILFLSCKGGSGGTYGVDGYSHIGSIVGGGACRAQDYEMFEFHDPHFLLKHEYKQDSAGAGQWRGGLGVETAFKLYGENTRGIIFGDGTEEGAFGLFGGKASSLNKIQIVSPGGEKYIPKSKDVVNNILPESVWEQEAGGGGGYGDPHLRPTEKVLEEVKNEFISIEKAREDYGVVIDPYTYEVNYQETERIRKGR